MNDERLQRMLRGDEGGFAAHLAEAYAVADSKNKTRLAVAFPEKFCDTDPNALTFEENAAIGALRERGFAVALMCPKELGGVDADRIETGMVEDAFERISYLKEE